MASSTGQNESSVGRKDAPTSPARPTDMNWTMADMTKWLSKIQEKAVAAHGDDAIYIHPKVISFKTSDQRDGWVGFEEEVAQRDYIRNLQRAPKPQKGKVWLALCDTWNESYVKKKLSDENRAEGKHQWDMVGQHTYVLVLLPSEGSGRDVFFFDCDWEKPEGDTAPQVKELRTGMQREFVKEMKADRNWNIKRVLVGRGKTNEVGKERCLSLSTEWMEELSKSAASVVIAKRAEVFDGFVEYRLHV